MILFVFYKAPAVSTFPLILWNDAIKLEGSLNISTFAQNLCSCSEKTYRLIICYINRKNCLHLFYIYICNLEKCRYIQKPRVAFQCPVTPVGLYALESTHNVEHCRVICFNWKRCEEVKNKKTSVRMIFLFISLYIVYIVFSSSFCNLHSFPP